MLKAKKSDCGVRLWRGFTYLWSQPSHLNWIYRLKIHSSNIIYMCSRLFWMQCWLSGNNFTVNSHPLPEIGVRGRSRWRRKKAGGHMVVQKVSMCNAGSAWLVCFPPSVAYILSAGCCSTGSHTFITEQACEETLYLGCLFFLSAIGTKITKKTNGWETAIWRA